MTARNKGLSAHLPVFIAFVVLLSAGCAHLRPGPPPIDRRSALTVVVADVGQGESVVIRGPTGKGGAHRCRGRPGLGRQGMEPDPRFRWAPGTSTTYSPANYHIAAWSRC